MYSHKPVYIILCRVVKNHILLVGTLIFINLSIKRSVTWAWRVFPYTFYLLINTFNSFGQSTSFLAVCLRSYISFYYSSQLYWFSLWFGHLTELLSPSLPLRHPSVITYWFPGKRVSNSVLLVLNVYHSSSRVFNYGSSRTRVLPCVPDTFYGLPIDARSPYLCRMYAG